MKNTRTINTTMVVLIGLLVIGGMNLLTGFLSFQVASNIIANTSPDKVQIVAKETPYLIIAVLLRILSYISVLAGGMFVGYMTKKKEWLYGGLLGVASVSIAIMYIFFISTFREYMFGSKFPAAAIDEKIISGYIKSLTSAPITIILASLGGIIGGKIAKKRI